jgi:hypothetical protein
VRVERDEAGQTVAWASWNGATRVAQWQLLAGDDPGSLRPAGRVPRDGFEAGLGVPDDAAVVAVRAIDDRGRRLATSLPVSVAEALDARHVLAREVEVPE